MNPDYQSQIENLHMKRRLLNRENIPAIEDLLDKESPRLERLQKLKERGKLNLGDKVPSAELRELFPQICREVDGFLGVQGGEVPKFGYYNLFRPGLATTPVLLVYTLSTLHAALNLTSLVANTELDTSHLFNVSMDVMQFVLATQAHSLANSPGYSKLSKAITLKRVARTHLIPTAGHEYAHSIQHKNGILKRKCFIFIEGHARGVERQLATNYREREENEAFLYGVVDDNVCELKSAYIWMCKKLGQQPRKSLLKTNTSRDSTEGFCRFIAGEPSSHAIGNALFLIYEALYGREIYNHMIHGVFKFS